MKIKKFSIADRSVGWFEGLMDGPWADRACWTVLILAVLYFGALGIRAFWG